MEIASIPRSRCCLFGGRIRRRLSAGGRHLTPVLVSLGRGLSTSVSVMFVLPFGGIS
jgi:hypothetical protein